MSVELPRYFVIAHHMFLFSAANCFSIGLRYCKFVVGEFTPLIVEEWKIALGTKFVKSFKAYQLTHVLFCLLQTGRFRVPVHANV